MPHLRIEYSTNIAERFDPARLAEAAAATLLASGVFEPPHSIKARLIPVAHFRVGGGADHGFLHADLALLSGRDTATKAALTGALVACLGQQLQPGPLTVQITAEARDMDRESYSKVLVPGL